MISIFVSTDYERKVADAIASEYRLPELVTLLGQNHAAASSAPASITVCENGIKVFPNWHNTIPPVLFPDNIAYSSETLLGIVFSFLSNFEKAYTYLAHQPDLLAVVDLLNRIVHSVMPDEAWLVGNDSSFTFLHNKAIALQYGNWQQPKPVQEIQKAYEAALMAPAVPEQQALTVKHYATFLNDIDQPCQSAQLIETFLANQLSPDAQIELKAVLCAAWLKKIAVPYDEALLEKLKDTLWTCLQHYEKAGRNAETALLLIDASQVANISNSFAESLGYINKAIGLLLAENLTELVASAQLRKGMLLYTWAQNGQPQFYRAALQALQEALTVFTREAAPDVFADIHHHLGVVYSEIQDEVKKKAVWAAVSVASFTEALNFYNKVDYPYEFAMICHNFGNAYTKYPAALHSDNYDKALAWYREALDIRTAVQYPLERCNTLYNYLEASWLVGNPDESFNQDRFNEMWAVASELHSLTTDEALKAEVAEHMTQLIRIKEDAWAGNAVTATVA